MSKNNTPQSNTFTLSSQVKSILQKDGFSHVFNWADYETFKKATSKAFNRPLAIAKKFFEDAEDPSDYQEYIF